MTFHEFQHYARLHVVGGLDDDEKAAFQRARREFGERAEEYMRECRHLNAAFALSLRPQAPREDARSRLMDLIHRSSDGDGVRAGRG